MLNKKSISFFDLEITTNNKYPALMPETLRKDIEIFLQHPVKYYQKQPLLIPEYIFEIYLKQMESMLDENDLLHPDNHYHLGWHDNEVDERVLLLAILFNLDIEYIHILRIAAKFHDFDHSGFTFRNYGQGKSNEEVAAEHADAFAMEIGLSLPQRLTLYYLIISTTYHNKDIKPTNLLEELLIFADLSGFIKADDAWFAETIAVLQELPLEERPQTVEEWIDIKIKFLNWAKTKAPKTNDPRIQEVLQHDWLDKLEDKIKLLNDFPNKYRKKIQKILDSGK